MSPRGVNVVGYLNHILGQGESARQFIRALRVAEVPHALAAIDLAGHVPLREPAAPWLAEAQLPFDVTVLWCNPDRYGVDVDPRTLPGRRIVGRWAWELAELPAAWPAGARWLSEVWTASRFVNRAVAPALAIPVRVMPMSIDVLPAPALDRRRWRLPRDRPLFLFMFDHHSTLVRKNPLGLVRAFAEAFPGGDEATLLIKTINAAAAPAAASELEEAAAEHPAVRIVDVALEPADRSALMRGCDCYVSLHRSEGFGMTIAEGMGYSRPVIATDFGGSTDLIDGRTGYPVPWRHTPVGGDSGVYPAGGVWAEPDLAVAARLLRDVLVRPREAAARGQRAARLIETVHAPAAVGLTATRELTRLGAL